MSTTRIWKFCLAVFIIIIWMVAKLIFSFTSIWLDLLALVIMTILLWILARGAGARAARDKINRRKAILIATISYLIVLFLLGLVAGFSRSIFDHSPLGIASNLFVLGGGILCQEIIRRALWHLSKKNRRSAWLIAVLMTLLVLPWASLTKNLGVKTEIFEFIFGQGVVTLFQQAVFTYLLMIGGWTNVLIHRLIIQITLLLVPIFPNLDWFAQALYNLLAYALIYFYIVAEQRRYEARFVRGKNRQRSSSLYLLFIPVIIILALFQAGIFKYQPVAVISNSMYPTFQRGDAVVIEKIKPAQVSDLQLGEVIVYSLDGVRVIHRLVMIEEDDGLFYFTTQGDNNLTPDHKIVSQEQVLGRARFYLPKFGWPSVWMAERILGLDTSPVDGIELGEEI